MRLEAGKGSAKIVDRNFTKQRWGTDKIKAALWGSFNHNSSDFLHGLQLTNNVYQIVNSLNNFVENIRRTHARNTKDINEAITAYRGVFDSLNSIHDYANYIDGEIKTIDNLISAAKDDTYFRFSIITLKGHVAGQNGQPVPIDQTLVNNINQYGRQLYSTIINTKEDTVWNSCINRLRLDEAKDIVNNALIKSKIEAIYSDVCWHKNQNIMVPDENLIPLIPKDNKREVMYLILKKAIEEQDNKYYNFSVESDFSKFNEDNEWQKLINGIRFTEQQPYKKTDFIISSLNLSDILDQYVWDNTEVGEIFFSDKEGKTLHLSENGITDYERKYDADIDIVNLTTLLRGM